MRRPQKTQAAIAARHRKSAKAAHRAKRGRYDTLSSEQKHGHEKRALKRHFDALAIERPFDAVLLKLDAQTTVRPRFLPQWSVNWRAA